MKCFGLLIGILESLRVVFSGNYSMHIYRNIHEAYIFRLHCIGRSGDGQLVSCWPNEASAASFAPASMQHRRSATALLELLAAAAGTRIVAAHLGMRPLVGRRQHSLMHGLAER